MRVMVLHGYLIFMLSCVTLAQEYYTLLVQNGTDAVVQIPWTSKRIETEDISVKKNKTLTLFKLQFGTIVKNFIDKRYQYDNALAGSNVIQFTIVNVTNEDEGLYTVVSNEGIIFNGVYLRVTVYPITPSPPGGLSSSMTGIIAGLAVVASLLLLFVVCFVLYRRGMRTKRPPKAKGSTVYANVRTEEMSRYKNNYELANPIETETNINSNSTTLDHGKATQQFQIQPSTNINQQKLLEMPNASPTELTTRKTELNVSQPRTNGTIHETNAIQPELDVRHNGEDAYHPGPNDDGQPEPEYSRPEPKRNKQTTNDQLLYVEVAFNEDKNDPITEANSVVPNDIGRTTYEEVDFTATADLTNSELIDSDDGQQ